jgi:hypothetical protein
MLVGAHQSHRGGTAHRQPRGMPPRLSKLRLRYLIKKNALGGRCRTRSDRIRLIVERAQVQVFPAFGIEHYTRLYLRARWRRKPLNQASLGLSCIAGPRALISARFDAKEARLEGPSEFQRLSFDARCSLSRFLSLAYSLVCLQMDLSQAPSTPVLDH